MSVIFILLLVLGIVWLAQNTFHSGVSKLDRDQILAGDDILPRPAHTLDRATILDAPVAAVWPWLVQLGKGRAGWYAPAWVERFVPANKQGAHEIVPILQKVRVGDIHPDWGPGSLQVLEIKKNTHIIYGSIKGKEDLVPQITFLFSWALILIPVHDKQCRLYIRLRIRQPKHPFLARLFYGIGGLFDYLTIIALFGGLKQRLRNQD